RAQRTLRSDQRRFFRVPTLAAGRPCSVVKPSVPRAEKVTHDGSGGSGVCDVMHLCPTPATRHTV
uniref:Uncharacterized protein n=1 Tax=Anopheles dirus TaxID=7168 RepID=A0A182NW56_9DIPT